MGGFHPSLVSDECLKHADAVIIGDAEDTWPELLDDLDRGSLKKRYVSTGNFSLADTKYDYSVIKSRHYRLIGMIQYCRGCKFSCDFCSIHAFYHDGIRFRSLEDTVTDIKNLKQKYVFFVDDNIFSDPEKASALIDAVKPLGKKWVCQISMDAARDPDLLKRMHESGCIMLLSYQDKEAADGRQNFHEKGLTQETFVKKFQEKFKFLDYAKVIFVSAKDGTGIEKIYPAIAEAFDSYNRRISTSIINKIIIDAQAMNPTPEFNHGRLKVLFANQVAANPPTFVFFCNNPKFAHFSYTRYLENRLRESFDFSGSPINIIYRERK